MCSEFCALMVILRCNNHNYSFNNILDLQNLKQNGWITISSTFNEYNYGMDEHCKGISFHREASLYHAVNIKDPLQFYKFWKTDKPAAYKKSEGIS